MSKIPYSKSRWLITGGVGALLTGLGLSLTLEASHWKHANTEFWLWIGGGTLGLILFMSGIILLIKAGHMEKKN